MFLPQALPPTVPMPGNYFIILFKEVPLVSTIGVAEILLRGQYIWCKKLAYLEPLTIVGIIFFLLSYPSAVLIRKLEVKMNTRFDKNEVAKSS